MFITSNFVWFWVHFLRFSKNIYSTSNLLHTPNLHISNLNFLLISSNIRKADLLLSCLVIKKLIIFQDEVRNQDTVFVIASVALNSSGRDLAWQFFKGNWVKISERYSGHLLNRLVKFLTEGFASEQMAKEVESFFETHKSPGTERTIQQAIETIWLNAHWLNRDSAAIEKYLRSI